VKQVADACDSEIDGESDGFGWRSGAGGDLEAEIELASSEQIAAGLVYCESIFTVTILVATIFIATILVATVDGGEFSELSAVDQWQHVGAQPIEILRRMGGEGGYQGNGLFLQCGVNAQNFDFIGLGDTETGPAFERGGAVAQRLLDGMQRLRL
jgi:hypothetical protein